MKTLYKAKFQSLGQEITLLQKGGIFYIHIEDLTSHICTPIRNASPRLYKQLFKVYTKLNKLVVGN